MKELSKKKYVTLITIMILVLGIIGIVNIGNTDLDKGKVKLKSASIEKLKSSVIESKGYEEITYPVLYELEKVEGIEERNVIIKGILTKEENKYARFKEITSKTITSTVSENGREIEIKIEKVKLGRQNKINIKIEINGAINETKIKPEIEIKEESEKEYTKVNTEEIEVKTNSVTGLVQDEEGMSVSNLELSINKGNEEIRRTYTDENGRYVFSDVEEGKYIIKVEEENYELKEIKEVEVIGGITENIIVKKIKPYEIEVKKYISKIKLNNNGKEIEYEYGKLNKVNQTVKNLKNLSGEIEYKIEIKNTGEKSGEITKIEEEVTEGLKFSKEKNSEWEEKNGKIINRSLEGIKLKAGEEKEITLKLDIEKTDEARSYLQKVTAKGEVYQNVVYILDGKEYRKEKVLDGEKIEEPKIVQENFKGWYTDKKYTNKYNFENSVTKDIILYGKIEESTKKYTVQYIDEGKIIKEEELEEGSIINAPEVTKEGYTFDGWYEGEEKYDVYEPITRNLILESKYEINKYKVRFINEDGSVLQEETLDYGSTPTYKKETPTKKRTEEYTYEFDKWMPEITKVTSNQEYKATYKETKNKYTVTYINDGEEYHKETAEYGSAITNVKDPTKEGYTFTGWYTKDNEKVSYPITVTKNITLYSKYEINSYKVSYYNEGKKYIDDQKINYGENALKPNTDPSKIGYTFKYWSLKENGEEYEFSTKITKDINLYAVYEINKYTVTYINEGIEYHKETAEYGSVVTKIQDPIKEGYTFTGWYTKDNEKVTYPITVTENITLYSKYEINSYKVSYYNEGKKYIEDQQINYGENALKPNTNPSKIGYTFKYWSLKENGEEYEFSTKITKDIALYAVYEINKYTVTYINEGVEYHKETAFYGSVVTSIQDPTKEGYTFTGWYTKDNEKVTYPITVTKNITLYSKYEINTYTVSFYHNNEKYVENQKVNYGESAVKPSIDPTKEDYNFSGWVIKGTNNKYDFTSTVTKDIELESSFTAKPTYTVTYKIGNEVILTENVIEGHKVTSKEAPYKKGYLFDKWYSDEGLTIENNFDEKIMGNKIIYGKYNENKHTVTYINEGTTYYTEEVLDSFTATGPSTNPEKEGYTFKYFSKDKKVAFDYNAEITEDTTLYAVYEINKYTVTYINEESEYHKEELTYGSKHEKIEDPFKTGYTFIGWYNENEEKVEYPITVTKDITLHSKYEINKYTVTYMNEGTKYIDDQQINYKEKAVKPEPNPSKIGYTFKYWSVKENGEEYNFNNEITEDITLYAVYEINKYTVTYINEGSEYHKEELTYGSKHEKIEDPFKTGYTFTGWYNENEEKVEYPIIVTKDITLHSKYEINKYTVTFNDEDRITTKEVNYNAKVEPVTNQGKTGYTFKYWSVEKGGEEYNFNTLVTENITLYAVYDINKYTVTFKNYDGSTLQEETLEYGTLPKYKGEVPTREKTKEYTYTFKGWNKEITEVTNNQEYIATYTETKNKYNVKFTNYDGSILQEETLEYGALPKYKGEVPTREKTEEYTYTFKSWNKEITEVTDNEIYIAVYKEEKNKYTVIYMDGETEYTRKEVNYGETVSEEVISKDHNIYRGWTLDENIYDFSTPVTKNITIKSSFELVESPIIESTPIEWTKEDVKVTITTNHNDYSYMYKIDDGEYQNYNGEFTVDKNCTVIAKSIKENVESEVTTKEITNIDKVLPEIKEITEENITTKSFDIKVKGQDNESGLSEIRIYKNEELMVSYPYTERLNEEKEETYSLTGLEENTTYKIKVELIDKVGNINVSEEKEITTLKRVIVSRIIGRNNSLYESEEEYELFESLEEAITSCGSNECTIEMVLDTKESVNVLEGQEIKLELNEKTVTGVRDYTIENSGELIIVDKEESEGGIINNTDTAIKNIGNGILQIGENEEPLSVSTTKPNIVGTTYGIYTEEETSKLKFYDGKIEGNVAIHGNVDDTPYLYNAKITNEGHQVATLSILAEAEAKITGGKYYTKLSNAVSETKSGTYELKEQDIMSTVITPGLYGFDYDEETNSLISNNKGISSTAHSYIKLDLTNYTEDQELIVETFVSSITQAGWAPNNYGYVTINDNKNDPGVSQTSGRIICVNGEKKETGRILLEKGKVYYIHLGYTRPSSYTISGDDSFKITKIMLSNYEIDKFIDLSENVVTTGEYGFIYSDGVLKSNNQGKLYTTANSYIKVDLTDYAVDQKIYISAEISSWYGSDSDPGYVIINDSEENPSYNDTNGRVIYISRNESVKDVAATLPAGKVSYIHFGYKKGSAGNYGTDTFTISSITYNKCTPVSNVTEPVPILNEKVDTVELIKDITLTSPIEISETKEMVLDLKGYTLTTSSNDYVIKNNGDLTIIDSKYSNEQDKNQADYEAEQAKYDEEYNQDLEFKDTKDKEYEKKLEEYEKKLEEYNKAHPNKSFEYTGKEEVYVVPENGIYKLETWGAQGGNYNSSCIGGYGSYSVGYVTLEQGDKLYINVGGSGSGDGSHTYRNGGYNGGGNGLINSDYNTRQSSGGGATHISSVSGILSTLSDKLDSVLIASGGGGAGSANIVIMCVNGGHAGGYKGNNGETYTEGSWSVTGVGGTQSQIDGANGTFGQGGSSIPSGGGGGLYGGSSDNYSAGGGSGYIGNSKLTNKAMYCYNCEESSDESTKTISTTNVSETPIANYAKMGNGYAKITKIDNTSSPDGTASTVTKIEKPLKPVNGYTTDDYVKDNIKLQLDGIDNTNESKWSNLSDNSNNGTITGATNQDTGYYFDGSNDYVSFTQMNYDNVTVEATFTPQISDGSERDIIANYNSGGYGLHIKNGYIYAQFYISGSYRTVQSLDKYEVGKTYVVQATYDGKEMKLYVNNKFQNIVSVTGTIGVPTNNSILMLGTNPNGKNPENAYFKGTIHSARIYDRALNSDELYKNYNSNEKRFIGIIRKEATLKEATLTGTITSTTNSVIYNSLGANLTIKEGNISLNKSGWYHIITNSGTISLLENGVLNTKQSDNIGIYNDYNANIKDGGGTINQNSSGYGIYNISKVDDGFSNITFNLNSGYAFYNQYASIELDNIKIINGTAYNIGNGVKLSFNNSIINSLISSNGMGIIEFNNVIHNHNSYDFLDGDITINNSDFNIASNNIHGSSNSKIRFNNSKLSSADINGYDTIEINDSSFDLNGYDHYGNPVISGTNVNIKGKSNIVGVSSSYSCGGLINATNLTIGENDGVISEYPYIKNVSSGCGLKATNLYIYDGSITTYKNKAVMSSITEIEENSKINITTDGDNETLSLVKAEDAVAQIGNETYTSLKSAVDAVKTGETIKILSDIYPIDNFELTNNNFTIDLNSNKVRSFSSDSLFNNAGELNVIDNSGNASGSINSVSSTILKNTGTLNVKNIGVNSINTINNTGTLNINNSKISSSGGYLVTNNEESNMTIESSTLNGGITNNGDMNINSSNVQSGSITNNNKLTTNNNTISVVVTNNAEKVFDSTSDTYNEVINNYGNYTVSETTINQTLNNYGSGIFNIKSGITKLFIYNRDTSTLNISGGTIGYGIENIGTGTVNMTGGNIDTSRNGITNNNGGTINIGVKDGTVNKESSIIKSSSDNGIYNGNGTLNFYDGTIKGRTAISGTINDIEENYDIIKQTENGLEVKYLGREYAAQIESTGEKYYTLKEAIDAVTNTSETVKVLRDITTLPTAETITITDDKNIILDLNGNVISQGNTPLIVNNGTLDLKDTAETKGGLVSTAGTIIENTGTLTMDVGSVTAPVKVTNLLNNSGTLIINNISMSVAGGSSNLIINTGNTTINKGSFYSDSINPAIYNKSDGTLTINDATITSNSYNRVITNEGTAYIYAKTITMNSYFAYTDAVYIYNATNANLTIDGFTGVQGRGGTVLQNDGTANILNSSFGTYAYIYNYSGTLNLTNDNFDSNFGNNSGTLNIYSGKYNQSIYTGSGTMFNIYDGVFNGRVSNDGGTLNIKGGTFNSGVQNTGTLNIGVKDGEVSTEIPYITGSTYGLEINGGTVNFYDGIISGTTDATKGTINDIEEGYEIISGTTEDGKKSKYLSRSQLAEIESTGEKYYTLQEAIDAVTVKDETIKMLRNYTTLNILDTITVAEDKSIILDLNGYKLEQNNEKFLINNGTLTITDSSENSTNKIEMYADKLIENNGTLILDSLNIDIKSTITNVINNKSTLKLVDSSVLNVSNRGGHSLFVENSGTLTLENTTMDFNYYDSDTTVNNTGTLNVIGGNYKIFGGKLFKNSSIVNVKGGTYTFTYWYESYYSAWLLYSTSNEDMTIDSINVISQNNGTKATSIYNSGASNTVNVINSNDQAGTNNASTGTMIITGGTLAGVNNSGMMTVSNSSIGGISNGSRVLDIKESTLSSISNYNGGTINVYDSNVSNNIGNSSIVNFYSGSVASSSIGVSNSGTFNLISGTITSTSNNAISNSGTINIGTKDGNVSTEMPVITGKTYGVSNGGSGKVNFYDGIVSGETGAFYGTVNEVEPGYKIVTNKTDTLTSATLSLIGDDEKVAVLNGINFTSLQDAINSASDTNESIITLYKDVTFESNITVPANKNIKLYLNGYTLNKGSYDFTGEGKITVIDGTSTNALANIMESVKEVLNIEGIKKNIIIYEMDDGSTISSESTYKLYKDNEEVILEEDAIGIYSVGNSNDEIRSANNKIYINELPKGKYKLIGDNNKEVKFEIDESGKIIGNVKENTKETRKLISTAVAELIIMIQTGIEKVNYIMIILTLLVTISSLLYIVKKTNVKES